MAVVIGLGDAGCNIAQRFGEYSEYSVYRIDVDLPKSAANVYNMEEQPTSEAYEKNCPDLKAFFKKIKKQEQVFFIIGGGGKICGAALQVLQQIQRSSLNIIYIKPDINLIGAKKYLLDRIAYNVLQQYSRSGVFDRMYIVSNPSVEESIGDVPVKGYYGKLNEAVVSTLHMINVFKNSKPDFENLSDPENHTRISSYGMIDSETGEEKLFFPLDNIIEKVYYIGINKESMEDAQFFRKLKENMRKKAEEEGVKISYSIYETKYDENYAYVVAHSDKIQSENNLKKSLTSEVE